MSRPLQSGDAATPVTHQYGEQSIQTVAVWPLEATLKTDIRKYWIIYIHGGAWRDPLITEMSFQPTISTLLGTIDHAAAMSKIAGFASINYRLSPHPEYPQSPDSPVEEFRRAKHPDHIHDVTSALALLESHYGIGSNYILVGHSCGATLAFQYAMGNEILPQSDKAEGRLENTCQAPVAILGIAGIYDLQLMVDTHSTISEYRRFVVGAFGEDTKLWDRVSPAKCDKFSHTWQDGKLVVLAHSKEDELIDETQMHTMKKKLIQSTTKLKIVSSENIVGRHDELWSRGVEVARLICITIQELENLPW